MATIEQVRGRFRPLPHPARALVMVPAVPVHPPARPRLAPVARGVALGVSFAVAIAVSMQLSRDGSDDTALIWLGNGIQLGALLSMPRPRWLPWLAAFAVIGTATMLAAGASLPGALATGVVNLLEVGIAARLLSGDRDWLSGRSERVVSWARFALLGVVAAPLIGTALALLAYTALHDGPPTVADLAHRARIWYVSDALAISLVVPLMLRLRTASLTALRRRHRVDELLALAIGLAAIGGVVMTQGAVLALFGLALPFIVVLFRVGFTGLVTATAALAPIVLGATQAGYGPFVTMAQGPGGEAVLLAQLFLICFFGMWVTVGALLDERERLAAGESANEQVYRMIAATSSDMILVLTDEGAAKYVSPAAVDLAGRNEDALLGYGWIQQLHVDDRDNLVRALNAVRDGAEADAEVFCRLRRSERDWRWLECRLRRGNGSPIGGLTVATVRDVTGRRQYEENLRAENALLAKEASTDALTGLSNRREFEQRLATEWRRAARSREEITLLVIDVDFFKRYNDRYGHAAGDRCLTAVARAMRGALRRPSDMCARYGGEEFVVLLPHTNLSGGHAVAETICAAVRRLQIPHLDNDGEVVTISVGVAAARPESPYAGELFTAADAALYQAKRNGRNRAEIHRPEPDAPALDGVPARRSHASA